MKNKEDEISKLSGMNNELSALGGQGDDTSKLQIHLQNANAKCVDLENQLQKAHGSLKN